jgi:phosphohistidine phosphatase SixA/CHAD domain-containing protein
MELPRAGIARRTNDGQSPECGMRVTHPKTPGNGGYQQGKRRLFALACAGGGKLILILIRHGSSERQSGYGNDWDRRLTPDGAAVFTGAAAGLALLLPAGTRVVSSPKARTLQTAGILASFMNRPLVEESDILLTDNLQGFQETYGDPAAWVAAVGHEPFMGQWRSRISGTETRFFPVGAAAVLETGEVTGRLLCDITPERAAALAQEKSAFPFEHLSQILRLRKTILSGNGVDEDIHQLRANIRRLILTLSCAGDFLPQAAYARTRESFKQLLDATDGLRECAVLKEMLSAAGLSLDNLAGTLEEMRKARMAGFISALSDGAGYAAAAESLSLLEITRKHRKLNKQAVKRCRRLMRGTARHMKGMDMENQETLHAMRISMRKLRDTALIFPAVCRKLGKKIFSDADALQASLGRGHDAFRCRIMLEEIVQSTSGDTRLDAEKSIRAIAAAFPREDNGKALTALGKRMNTAYKKKSS